MRFLIAIILVLHGGIHLMGFVKAFGLADVPALRDPISARAGTGWLVAALLLGSAAVLLLLAEQRWWMPAITGVLLSQVLIVSAWHDAKFGTLANVIVAVPIVLALQHWRAG
jgi:hypothetical protein